MRFTQGAAAPQVRGNGQIQLTGNGVPGWVYAVEANERMQIFVPGGTRICTEAVATGISALSKCAVDE
jgi:hypothetical protein